MDKKLRINSSAPEIGAVEERAYLEIERVCIQFIELSLIKSFQYLKTHHLGKKIVCFSDLNHQLRWMIDANSKVGQQFNQLCWSIPASATNYLLYLNSGSIEREFINHPHSLLEDIAKLLGPERSALWLATQYSRLEEENLERNLKKVPRASKTTKKI